ncbi:MAG TPA: FtsX-like permease family protein, partial [Candidatus Sulfopaludibacter sp.]|nr:FtsX-like permease family protein [Candidatus Sulfopaludibacter sp.]
APADIWVPLEQAMPPGSPMWTRGRWLQLLARLGPGVTHAQAEAEATALTGRKITLQQGGTGFSRLRERFSRPVIVLECVVALVLLIACANLANLTLAGAASRHSEFALRKAIGAGRGRLVRQLLTENLLVSALGAMLALAVAGWMSAAMLRFLPPEAAPALANLRFHLNGPVLAFTASVSLATCLLLGLAPAIRATSHSLAAGMKREGNWANRGLIVAEVAMCTLLLIGAALFVESLRNLRALPTGYSDVEHIVTADVEMPRTYSAADRRQRMEDLRQRAAALPGVQVAATSHIRPLSGFSISDGIPINGEIQNIDVQHVSPGFLAAMGTPLITGRDFSERDDTRAPQVAIVNESFVRQFLADGNPLGAHFGLEIVGVVRDTRWINLKDKPPAMYYRPLAQWDGTAMTLVVRATGDFATVSAGLGRAAHDVDPKIALRDVVPFREMEDRILVIERMLAQGATAFGALALLVACIGLYGVLAYGVARRTREIGVRMALGASRGGVQWMVLRESLALLAVGFAIGVPAALALTRYSAAMLFGITAHDPRAMVSALGILLAVALAAAAIPARRAASVDPLTALRYE